MRCHSLILIASLLIVGLGLQSCESEASDTVVQDRIFAEYELFYNANEDKTYARTTFHFGNLTGTRLELSNPSTITFNGEPLDWRPVLAYYELALPGRVAGTFVWTDTDGNTFTNAASLPTFAYSNPPSTIVRDSATTLNWQEALAVNENVAVVVNGQNEADAQTFVTTTSGATSIILDRARLQNLGDGPGTVFLDRRRLPVNLEATSAGAILTERVRPVNLSVTIN